MVERVHEEGELPLLNHVSGAESQYLVIVEFRDFCEIAFPERKPIRALFSWTLTHVLKPLLILNTVGVGTPRIAISSCEIWCARLPTTNWFITFVHTFWLHVMSMVLDPLSGKWLIFLVYLLNCTQSLLLKNHFRNILCLTGDSSHCSSWLVRHALEDLEG